MAERLDDAFHSPARLQVAAFLSGCDEAVFATVLEGCGLTKSTLSKSVYALEEVGYLSVRKGRHERLPRTWLSLTPGGRLALARHLDALRQIADQAAGRAVSDAVLTPRRTRHP